MCLIVFAWDAHPKYKLILAANRDEFYERPTLPAHFWKDVPEILGGRDLKAQGTWMAVNKSGKFAAVTNYRDLLNLKEKAISRGELPTHFLTGNISMDEYLQTLTVSADNYNGFNLLLASGDKMQHLSNHQNKINDVYPGVHGLSNALMDTPWPKVQLAKNKFERVISKEFSHDSLIALMQDQSVALESQLPETGVSKDIEKSLSAMCIRMEDYGTCCTTALTISHEGIVKFSEFSYAVGNRKEGLLTYEFDIEK